MLKKTHFGNFVRFDLARTLWGKGRYWTAAYWVDGLLIDTGCAHTARELASALLDTPVLQIVNTHSHEDHIGGNGLLQRSKPDPVLWAHTLALPILANPHKMQPLHPYRKIFWGWPEASHAQLVSDGAVIETEHYRFQVIYTPGHCPDHICLYEQEQGWLFTGDLYVGGQDRALRVDYDIKQIIESLKRIARLPATTLFPASARVRENPTQALTDKIAYFEQLGEQVRELDRQGKSVREIARALCGGPMFIERATLGHMTREHLVESYLR